MGVVFVVATLVVVSACWAAATQDARNARALEQRLEAMLDETVAQVGGELERAHTLSRWVDVEGVRLAIEVYDHISGNTPHDTRVIAHTLIRGPKLRVVGRLEAPLLERAHGMDRVRTEDDAFDRAFSTRAQNAAAVCRVVSATERARLMGDLRSWTLSSDGMIVTMNRSGYAGSAREVEAAARIVVAVASAGQRALDAALAHPDARPEGPGATFDAAGVEGRFSVGPEECALTVSCTKAGPGFEIDCAAPDVPAQLPRGLLEASAIAEIECIGGASLRRDDSRATVEWRETPNADQIEAAWRVLVSVAAPPTRVGAFR